MKYYKLKKLNNSKYLALVLSNSLYSPLSYRNEIAKEIRNIKGYVLFDLLPINGRAKNRFIEGYFDGNSFIFDSFKSVSNIPEEILRICYDYYIENRNVLHNSSLTNIEKFLFIKDINIKY